MKNYTMIDNFLPEEEHKKILEVISDTGFDWHLTDKITIEQKDEDIFSIYLMYFIIKLLYIKAVFLS